MNDTGRFKVMGQSFPISKRLVIVPFSILAVIAVGAMVTRYAVAPLVVEYLFIDSDESEALESAFHIGETPEPIATLDLDGVGHLALILFESKCLLFRVDYEAGQIAKHFIRYPGVEH